MKTFFSIIFAGSFLISTASAQNGSTKASIIGTITPPSNGVASENYLLSFSEQDFQARKYVFYTDSNATVAHITINGKGISLTGGPNAEHIMIYTHKEYTITLSPNKNKDATSAGGHNGFTLAVYVNGQAPVVEQVIGAKITN